jgi:DNA polymerase-3 subunit delta'
MGFDGFIGNERIVAALRRMLAAERIPHALLFSGPRGVGKFTLARMFASAVNCERRGAGEQAGLFAAAGPKLGDDFCGECATCAQNARLADLQPLIARGLEERGQKPDTATIERVPLILQGHPDVWAIVPDPVRPRDPVARPVIRVGQLRAIQRAAYFRPSALRRVFIVDGADTMTQQNSNLFLKVLEEPPESATLILIAPNPYVLLETIRSRCLQFFFGPVAAEHVEQFLKERTELKPAERKLAAQLSGGSPGAALTLDLAESAQRRRDALRLIEQAATGRKWAEFFALTARLGKDEKESFEKLIEVFYSLCNDLLELQHSPGNCQLRNPDLRNDLEKLRKQAELEWLARAVEHLDELQARLRRNVSRQLALDALVAALGAGPGGAGLRRA